MHQAIISSNSSHERIYKASSRSAIKAIMDLGYCESGKVVRIYSRRAACFLRHGGRPRMAVNTTVAQFERR